MRLPYVSNPPPTATPQDAAIVARIQSRRAPRPLQSLDLALLHSPPVADGWNSFLGAIRTQTSLAADVREIAICRVAVCNKAWYEWGHHAPLASEAGLSPAGLEVIKREVLEGLDRPDELDDRQWAVLLYADEMTRSVQVKDQTFELLHKLFSNQEVVEITATVAAYNCVSRFLVALNVGERNGSGPDQAPAQ
ncbi:carboxymuconolactone decarboxylase family protein [Hirsutella rhossiliensis]|uniref:Carboxymuconolactone decarboxylase family domain-containing protein n=1 Tax=Hirsutella rhossiliensis TaxID=111463 RepID=A0A9P8N6C2_9HYPO|nr:carboxymuconolactone decarboxylase family domain-containing protein [Hirsutella rhossiliensis]KAH0967554.1 carboxymuconolactone decarboxylase family domain-containing protein [Hirsutella rhossiliensis]